MKESVWKRRYPTIIGKCTIINSYLYLKIMYSGYILLKLNFYMFQKTFQSLSLFKHNCVSATSSRGKAVYKCRKAKITGSLNSSSCSMPDTKHVIFTNIIHHYVRSMNPLNLRKKGQSYTLYNGQI